MFCFVDTVCTSTVGIPSYHATEIDSSAHSPTAESTRSMAESAADITSSSNKGGTKTLRLFSDKLLLSNMFPVLNSLSLLTFILTSTLTIKLALDAAWKAVGEEGGGDEEVGEWPENCRIVTRRLCSVVVGGRYCCC